MSVDSDLYRLSASQFQDFLDDPEAFVRPEIADNEYFWVEKAIADDAKISFLHINEHFLAMFAHIPYGDGSIFNEALIEGRDSQMGKYNSYHTYLSPEEVKEMAAALVQVTPADLRALFEMYPGHNAEQFAKSHPESYPDLNALLARQNLIYQNIRRFYTQASNAGDAVLIQYE